jgi:hypothetical protein
MIISDEDSSQVPKLQQYSVTRSRLTTSHLSTSSLPDYDTSEKHHVARKRNATKSFWRGALCSLAVYVCVTLLLAIPFIVLVSAFVNILSPLLSQSRQRVLRKPYQHTMSLHVWGDDPDQGSSQPELISTNGEGGTDCDAWDTTNDTLFTAR